MIDNDGIEKDLKELTGISISQLRSLALQRPLADTVTRGQSNAPQSPIPTPPAPQIEVTDQHFSPKPFREPSAPTQTGGGTGSGLEAHTIIIVENGIGYYAQVQMAIGGAV